MVGDDGLIDGRLVLRELIRKIASYAHPGLIDTPKAGLAGDLERGHHWTTVARRLIGLELFVGAWIQAADASAGVQGGDAGDVVGRQL